MLKKIGSLQFGENETYNIHERIRSVLCKWKDGFGQEESDLKSPNISKDSAEHDYVKPEIGIEVGMASPVLKRSPLKAHTTSPAPKSSTKIQ